LRKTVELTVCPSVFDTDVLALDVVEFTETLLELLHAGLRRGRRVTREELDPVHLPSLLRLSRERR
jgi:hypothetical protein